MALHRKLEALLSLAPDIAVISECAGPEVLSRRGVDLDALDASGVWIGKNRNKRLGVVAFNGYRAVLANYYQHTLKFITPVEDIKLKSHLSSRDDATVSGCTRPRC